MLYCWYKKLFRSRVVMTGPDCSYLHYQLIKAYSRNDAALFPKDLWQIKKYKELSANSFTLESLWANSNALLHVVGADDKKAYDQLGKESHSFFSLHPHSSYEEIGQPIDEEKGKLTVLISGVNHSIYTGNFSEKIFDVLTEDTSLALRYRFLIIGKGFEPASEKLKRAGYEVEHHLWVDNYESAIRKAHIQIFPIIVGTGTKGKVLCALATGLLCIGTKHAFENISIEPGKDTVLFDNSNEIINILNDIYNDKAKSASMAKNASQKVRKMHSPGVTSKSFWDVVLNHWRNN
jgi:glycosyltransferase involved in cell wall biosynthesis